VDFHVGLLATAFGFGLRHGIDWDHLAAITDITSAQRDRRRSLVLASLYATGHACVVFVLGVAAVVAGERLPENVDAAMGRVVGATLVLLGAYVFWSLARHGPDFRMRSRWMLIFEGVRRLVHRLRHRPDDDVVSIEHEHDHTEGHHHHADHVSVPAAGRGPVAALATHTHVHRHVGSLPTDPFGYGRKAAFGIGALHGIGAETPTQVVLFVTAAGVAGRGSGVLLLLAFLAGLLVSNTAVAVASTYGVLHAERSRRVYIAVAVLTGTAGLALGTLFLLGRDSALPVFFGG
jgi:high-affinity nickel-transport protein